MHIFYYKPIGRNIVLPEVEDMRTKDAAKKLKEENNFVLLRLINYLIVLNSLNLSS